MAGSSDKVLLMIDKLNRKIFWSILLSAMAVLLVIVVSYDVYRYAESEREKWQMLSVVLDEVTDAAGEGGYNDLNSGKGPGDFGSRGRRKGQHGAAHIIDSLVSDEMSIVLLGSGGQVTESSGFFKNYDQNLQDSVISDVLANSSETGTSNSSEKGTSTGSEKGISTGSEKGTSNGVRYMSRNDGTGTVVVLMENEPDEDIIILFITSLLGLAAAFAVFAFIARKLSASIVKPVEETMERQKRFIADASHELKTPVAVISANAEVLEKQNGSSKWLGYIRQEADRMTDLIGQLLQLSKIDYEDEHGAAEAVDFDVVEKVMEAALPLESIAYEHGAKYRIKTPRSLQAHGRPDDVRQIVGILLDNAFKHLSKGGEVVIHVLGGEQGVSGNVIIRVSNTGETIPPDVLPHVFDRFYKEDASRHYETDRTGGRGPAASEQVLSEDGKRSSAAPEKTAGSFGLGLAIAKALTERNDGEISAESKDGITTFEVRLPVR